mmetsp:Transcript_42252/g.111735  ORF Transcript_42252/g.111735 Transcript_42252/m.111735 type:complete len:194 (+) Transcript_42252:28-609(+)
MEDGSAAYVRARAELSCVVDLERACGGFVNCELSRKPKAPLVIRLQKPPSVVKLQENGLLSFAGRGSVGEARLALKRVARRCQRAGLACVKFKRFQVLQLTQDRRLAFAVNLLQLGRCPGAEDSLNAATPRVRISCCRASDGSGPSIEPPGVQVDVFAQGRLRLTGARSAEELRLAMEYLEPMLAKCKAGVGA